MAAWPYNTRAWRGLRLGQRHQAKPKAQRMIEITENLHRAELTALERSKLVAEWAELTGEKVRQVDAPLPGGKQPNDQGTRKAARELGLSEPDVRRSRKVASLSPEAHHG